MTHKLSLKISGPAYRVTCYVIDEEILQELRDATIEDAVYEDNPISLVANIALRSEIVANGFCVHKSGDFKCEVFIDNEGSSIEGVGFLCEGDVFEEDFQTERNATLIGREENVEFLGEGFSLAHNEMFVVEVEGINYAEMTFDIDSPFQLSVQDIELGLVDLDADTDISHATYDLGLLNGMEQDIRYVLVNGEKYDFDMEVLNSYSSDFYLVRKSKNGAWTKEWLSSDDDE